MPIENLAVLKTGFEIVKGAKDLTRRDKPDHRLNDLVCKALRTAFFTPNGILSLLKELVQSNGKPSDQLTERLINFNDREWEVRAALELLDFDRLQRDLRLSLKTARTLNEIRIGKITLRQSIQEEVNYYGQHDWRPDLKEIRALVAAIEKLNAEIEEIEGRVNSRAIER
jgi:cell division septum initiation protein DivIVA